VLPSNQKRLLALDGGGIMGLISLQILKEIESQLAVRSGRPDQFLLRDFFDYIGGTSTGAIIGAALALGWTVQRLIDFYEHEGRRMFSGAYIWRRVRHKFDSEPLAMALQRELGQGSIFDLQNQGKLSKNKHLLIVTQNISSNSPWPISTNPLAKFNSDEHEECNRRVPLWQWVRASTAAPTYFPPQAIELKKGHMRRFEDGAVTPYNNPALLLYRMATLPEYRCGWSDGERAMMLVSVGTGCVAVPEPRVNPRGRLLSTNARQVASGLMQRISTENDILCRTIGRCVFGAKIDEEIGDLVQSLDTKGADLGKRFLYARYDPDLSDEGLRRLQLPHLASRKLAMDDVSKIEVFSAIGRAYAKAVDMQKHFTPFLGDAPAAAPEAAMLHVPLMSPPSAPVSPAADGYPGG
jgi:uncharacterized protein